MKTLLPGRLQGSAMTAYTGRSLFVLLFFHSTHFSLAQGFSVVGPSHPIVSYVGEDVILPASLSPAMNAEGFQVRWYTTDISSPVLLYMDNRIVDRIDRRLALFEERLKSGNISLMVQSVRVSDEGLYRCFVDSGLSEDVYTITLSVEALGAQPSISMRSTQGQKTRLECSAENWNPKPEVTWRDMNGGDMTSQSTIKSERDSKGLLTVSSVLPVKEEYNVFSCLMRSKAPKPDWPTRLNVYSFSPGVSGWLVTFCVLLGLCVLLTGLLIFQWRKMTDINMKYHSKVQRLYPVWFLYKEIDMAQHLTNTEWKRIYSSAADVTFDPDTAHPQLIVSENGKEVRHTNTRLTVTDNPKRFVDIPLLQARQGLTSGRHYWEVEVGEKTAWILGVIEVSQRLWTVLLTNVDEYSALTDDEIRLTLRVKPRTVGVFVDYDKGQVSFYNSDSHSHIYTFMDSFTETLYPLFSPGYNDSGKNADPLVIRPFCTT